MLDTGVWNIAKNPYPARYGLSMTGNNEDFPEPNDEGRIEIKTVAFAIDSKWSNDPDDAIAFDGQYLWVHVADPASVILPDSPADVVARTRGSTLYLPDGQIRMLSQKSLDDYGLGLKEGLSRALSFKIKLSDKNCIENVEVLKTFHLENDKVVLALDEANGNVELAGRNLPNVLVGQYNHISVYQMMNAKHLVITKTAVEKFEEVLK